MIFRFLNIAHVETLKSRFQMKTYFVVIREKKVQPIFQRIGTIFVSLKHINVQ